MAWGSDEGGLFPPPFLLGIIPFFSPPLDTPSSFLPSVFILIPVMLLLSSSAPTFTTV